MTLLSTAETVVGTLRNVPLSLLLMPLHRYWREKRTAFGRFESDLDGLFFMHADPLALGQKRARIALRQSSASCLGDTEVIVSD